MKLTKFEVARMLGARAMQISEGAPITIETDKSSTLEIAMEEIKKGTVPLRVKRPKIGSEE
ncbi:DNA-directed RNA polymerase subunit K [Methanotorris igneus]|uniref:DNA-directed RNA polymerase subunit Rpo6 n=1 Tax=Methanotorris igneus (strain DSM 5666 / JCM 11834 / Kol 5) TaxID=880724 RepID=F6BD50_METIK|nr:DNA-directed RNA polymerase subunit K [Methanotorris igneus]AEF96411.1 DNA-directed RNA polymerase subunit K [Methanotorris igneus Kol 5]